MTEPLRILFVEDLPTDQELAEWQLRAEGLDFISLRVETRDAFLQAVDDFQPDLIISDYAMPEFDGMQALKLTQELKRDIPFIVLTGSMNEETAVKCIKAGAYDYVIKEHIHRLPFVVKEALKQQQARKEKEQAEESLRESEIRYRNLIMHSPDAIFIDHQDSIILVNQACIKLFGAQKEEELIGKSPFDLFHPDYHKKMKERIHHLRELKEPVPVIEEKIIRLDGRIVDVDVLAAPFSFGGSNDGHVILRDITERKQQEAEIIKNNRDINLLYEAGKQLSQSLDLQHIYLTFYKLISSTMKCDMLYISDFDSQSELISAKFAVMEGKPVDVRAFPAIPLEPEGHGIQSPVIRSGKSVIINHYAEALKQTKTNYYIDEEGKIVEKEDVLEIDPVTQSSLIVPILLNNQVTGVVQIQSCKKDAYSAENLKMAEALASQIAVAATNAQLYQQSLNEIKARIQAESSLLNHAQRQEKMAALGRELSASLDLEVIYQTAERHLKKMVDCPKFGITLFDPQRLVLTVAYSVVDGVIIDPTTLPPLQYNYQLSSGGRSEAVASKTPVIVHGLAAIRKASEGMLVGGEQEPESAFFVPILVNNEVIGLLEMQSCQKDVYLEEDAEWLSMVANQIGLAIQNARLFAQTRQRVAELLVMHNIDQAITTSDDSTKIYQDILDQIATQPYVDAADILIFDPQEKLLLYTAGRGFSSATVTRTRLHLGEGLAGKAALEKHSIHLLNPADEIPGFFRSPLWEEEGFAAYLGLPLLFQGKLKGVLEIFSRKPNLTEPERMNFMGSLGQQVAIAVDNVQLFQGLQQANIELLQAYDATIAGWSQAMDLRDKETEGHTERVTNLTLEIARALGLDEEKLVHARRGALLHDIGKLGVPDHILHKPGPLTDDEWFIMKKHPEFAYQMLSPIDYLHPALAIPYCHHEKWDGTGYPRGLKGQQIPLEARIFALVDVYDALTTDRPYRPAWSQEETLAYIQAQSGKQFDPKITEAFSVLLRKLKP